MAADPAAPDLALPVPEGSLIVAPLDPGAGGTTLLSVIVPTFNEGLNIAELVGQLTRLLEEPFGERYEIIVVDDDSPDRTWELAQTLVQEFPRLRVMRRDTESGLSTAVIRGWQAARGEVLCVIDADLQHPPDVAMALYRVIERGADIAVASRHLEGGGVSDWSLTRRIVSRTAQLIGLLILPGVVGRVSDPMSGYFMIRRSAIEGVELNPLGYKILIEVLARGRVPWVGEVPYVFQERTQGGSKATARVYLDYLRHLLRLRLAALPVNRFIRFAVVGFGRDRRHGAALPVERSDHVGLGAHAQQADRSGNGDPQQFLLERYVDLPRSVGEAARLAAAAETLGQVPADLPGGCGHQYDFAQYSVQFARNEPLRRQRRRHRRGDGLEFLAEPQAQLANRRAAGRKPAPFGLMGKSASSTLG